MKEDMRTIMIEKIKKLFESINCFPQVILETNLEGELVDNGCGLEFGLPKYAIIYKGNIYKNSILNTLDDFESKNNINIMKFEFKNCNFEELIDELNSRDGYVVKWKLNG